MLHSESPLCQEHGCHEHSYNPIPAVDERGILTQHAALDIIEASGYHWENVRKLLVAQQAYDQQAMRGPSLEMVKAVKNRVINALIPYLKHSHRDRPINPNLYGGPIYSDATDCEACGMVGQLRRGK